MKDKHITSPKGMNNANLIRGKHVGMSAPHKGHITDGADLKKGFKNVKPDHTQKGAYSPHNKSDNMAHKR
jgi:hypothetical protein